MVVRLDHLHRHLSRPDTQLALSSPHTTVAATVGLYVRLAAKDEPACRILVSTIVENQEMMKELLDVEPQKFQPSIPNLVYQYNFYCNYKSEGLDVRNDEIPA